jgi:hypothetical protein
MSKISLKPNASGTGVFSLEAPNSNVDRTLTLPDEEGTVATIENIPPGYEDQDALDLFNVTGSAPVYACRAWVSFDGNNASIRDSGNVSSISDLGSSSYDINFTTNMPDINYVMAGSVHDSGQGTGGDGRLVTGAVGAGIETPEVGGVSVQTLKAADSQQIDSDFVHCAFFR